MRPALLTPYLHHSSYATSFCVPYSNQQSQRHPWSVSNGVIRHGCHCHHQKAEHQLQDSVLAFALKA
eukprot:481178-Amphidinium_carterae.1